MAKRSSNATGWLRPETSCFPIRRKTKPGSGPTSNPSKANKMETALATAAPQTLSLQTKLMHLLTGNTVGMIMSQKNEPARMVLSELRREASIEKAHNSKKMTQVKKAIGEESLHKLLCFILKCFQDSLKITNPANEMSASELFEAADMLMGTGENEYGHESVFDVIMALKHFKANPFELFNAFNDMRLRRILTNYLETKADWLESHNGKAGRDALRKDPLTVEQVRSDYEASVNKLPMAIDLANQEAKQREDEYQRRKAAAMVEAFVLIPEQL